MAKKRMPLSGTFMNRQSLILLIASLVLVAAVAFIMPGLTYYIQHIIVLAVIYVILVSSLEMLAGNSGLLSLGHQGFFGLGAYSYALFVMNTGLPSYLGLFVAVVVAVPVAYLVGRITLRLRAAFFVIATLAFALITGYIVMNSGALTGGPNGLPRIPPLTAPGGFVFDSSATAFIPISLVAIACVYLSWVLKRSKLGRELSAFRENEDVAKAIGVNVPNSAMRVFLFSAMPASLAGALYAGFLGLIAPEIFSLAIMATILLMLVAGGIGTVAGPIIGALTFTIIPEAFRFSDQWRLVVFGLLLILLARFVPGGIWGLLTDRFRWLASRRNGGSRNGRNARALVEDWNSSSAGTRPIVAEDPTAAEFRAVDISISYGSLKAVDNISVDVRQGERVGLIGPNGAGKSSFFNATTGYLRNARGECVVGGRKVRFGAPWEFAKAGVVRTFQNHGVFGGLTVAENIEIALLKTISPLGSLKDRPVLAQVLELFDDLDVYAKDLPYGKQRFLNVCTALLMGPRFLLLDEPAAGLNVSESRLLSDLLREASEHRCGILVVEHDMQFLMDVVSRLYVMDAGKLISRGTVDEVRNDPKVQAAYLGTPEGSLQNVAS